MRTLKQSMIALSSVVALGSLAVVAAPAPSHAVDMAETAINKCGANPCSAEKPRFSRYGKR